jgi:heme exporter protein C
MSRMTPSARSGSPRTPAGSPAGAVLNAVLAAAAAILVLVAVCLVFGGYVPTTKRQAQHVEIGSTVRLKDTESGEILTLVILPSGETPRGPSEIPAGSPLGRALLGKERTTRDAATDRAVPTIIEAELDGRPRRFRFDPDAPQMPYDQKIEALDIPQRIFYFHVPSAIITFLAVFLVGGASLVYLLTRSRFWDRVARSGAELGILFCTIVLLTGPIWAKPEWGHYWTWEWRLNFTAILWLVYLGYNLVRAYSQSPEEASLVSAVLGLLSVPLVPLVYVAAELWEGSHPKPTLGRSGAQHDPLVSQGFLFCLIAFFFLFTALLVLRTRLLGLEEELERLKAAPARAGAGPAPESAR